MKTIFNKFLLISLLGASLHATNSYAISSVAFNYGTNPPLEKLRGFDAVVINPSAEIDPKKFNNVTSELFAYVSVGEVANSASYRNQIPKEWLLTRNKTWNSEVVDQSSQAWRDYFINKLIAPLWAEGYKGFFLDTLDSYQLSSHDPAEEAKQKAGLIALIKAIKQRFPEAKLIFNRGFELLPDLHQFADAVAVESYFYGWNEQQKKYYPVSPSDRAYLQPKLKTIQSFGIPVIIIDYLPPNQIAAAQADAKQISALKMIPWITDGELESVGFGNIAPLQRKIFIIYTPNEDTSIFDASAFVLLATPLEYLGYVSEYHNANTALPENFSPENYAGIIVWAHPSTIELRKKLHDWLVRRLKDHTPIAFFNSFGFDPTAEALAPFHLQTPLTAPKPPRAIHIAKMDKASIGYEIKPFLNRLEFFPLQAIGGEAQLQVVDENNVVEDAIATTPWGGYALDPYLLAEMPNEENFWILNPIAWLQKSLRLEKFPVPDSTTENGRRILFVHIDGDGFPSQAEWNGGSYAAVELYNRILKKYQIPTTVSVITGDIAPNGLYPALSPTFVNIAKNIFALPWVEVATHTYSHPFDWQKVRNYPHSGKYNLPIPKYIFNPETEIKGSADYINRYLAPANKKCKILLWSGYANPSISDLKVAYDAGLENLNGRNTYENNQFPSSTDVAPSFENQGGYYHVYPAIANEESYTNSWSNPFYGFQRAIETMQLTDKPHRFKPLDIYYHFYSASKLSALSGLEKVYDWALQQPTHMVYASEYVKKVVDTITSSIVKVDDGWEIISNGAMRELHVQTSAGIPDLARSQNLIGFNQLNDVYYLHLGPSQKSIIYFTQKENTLPYLIDSNGSVTYFKRDENGMTFRLQSYNPLEWRLGNMLGCHVKKKDVIVQGNNETPTIIAYKSPSKDSDELRISCEPKNLH